MSNIPRRPARPERICWGCEKHCAADDLGCGNGTIRTPHPCELFGDDWSDWSDRRANANPHPDAVRPLTIVRAVCVGNPRAN
jgi:hypothetical protein